MSSSAKATGKRFKQVRTEASPGVMAGFVLVAFYLVLFFAIPPELRERTPTFVQRIVAVAASLLAMLTVVFALRDWGYYQSVSLPLVGRVKWSTLVGGCVFLAVFAWWVSPWTPLQPSSQALEAASTSR
jgi:membrane associated rhomboid family serine protease